MSCKWFFEFKLKTNTREYTFRAPSKEQRDLWIRIFKLLIEMNKKSISASNLNPFAFEEQQKHFEVTKTIAKSFLKFMAEECGYNSSIMYKS